jgi:hypothetical protein
MVAVLAARELSYQHEDLGRFNTHGDVDGRIVPVAPPPFLGFDSPIG